MRRITESSDQKYNCIVKTSRFQFQQMHALTQVGLLVTRAALPVLAPSPTPQPGQACVLVACPPSLSPAGCTVPGAASPTPGVSKYRVLGDKAKIVYVKNAEWDVFYFVCLTQLIASFRKKFSPLEYPTALSPGESILVIPN